MFINLNQFKCCPGIVLVGFPEMFSTRRFCEQPSKLSIECMAIFPLNLGRMAIRCWCRQAFRRTKRLSGFFRWGGGHEFVLRKIAGLPLVHTERVKRNICKMQCEKWKQLLPKGVFTQQAEAEAEANKGEDVHFSRCDASRVLCGWGVRQPPSL